MIELEDVRHDIAGARRGKAVDDKVTCDCWRGCAGDDSRCSEGVSGVADGDRVGERKASDARGESMPVQSMKGWRRWRRQCS